MGDNLLKKPLDVPGLGDRPAPGFGDMVVIVGNVALDLVL
jgi:hypothetical protein